MTKLSLTDEQRRDIVRYRLETALSTLSEVESHKANGFYNTAVNRLYYACYYAARNSNAHFTENRCKVT